MKTETFKKVIQPALSLYYYKNKVHQDSVVSVAAIKIMMEQLGTPDNLKRSVAIPNADSHVIGSYIKSKDVEAVQSEIEKFMIEVVRLKPLN